MSLWTDHEQRRHVFGDWTVVNIIAWAVIYALVIGLIAAAMWASVA